MSARLKGFVSRLCLKMWAYCEAFCLFWQGGLHKKLTESKANILNKPKKQDYSNTEIIG